MILYNIKSLIQDLEITAGERILFVGNYGQTSNEFATPEALINQTASTTKYEARADGHELAIVLKGESCRDSMSDESFETSVTVILDGKTYYGCGKALH